MTLYLKYRSQTLEELDLENVRETLKKIVSSGEIPHAFLFAGPKGTGKTSSARILAKILNCENLGKDGEPCGKCSQCASITKGTNLDVLEIDAASHRGIDDVRSLRDAVKLAPAYAKKKAYIIDEAHMLTVEASNALLKTLEEPPSHVVFILATTNPEKLLDTIRSRTTVVNFTKATKSEITRSLERIIKGENLKIENKVLELIAKTSDGSFRDAAKVLENLVSQDALLVDKAKLILGGDEAIENLVMLLEKKDLEKVLGLIKTNIKNGQTSSAIMESLLSVLRRELLAKFGFDKELYGFDKKELIHLIKLLIKSKKMTKYFSIEELPLEIAVIEWIDAGESGGSKKTKDTSKNEKAEEKLDPKDVGEEIVEKVANSSDPVDILVEAGSSTETLSDDVWKKILIQVKPINASVEALLRSSKPISFDGSTLKLGVFYKFHKERLEDTRHRKILEDVVSAVTGCGVVHVVCSLATPPEKKIEEIRDDNVLTESGDQDIMKIAEDIFGK